MMLYSLQYTASYCGIYLYSKCPHPHLVNAHLTLLPGEHLKHAIAV